MAKMLLDVKNFGLALGISFGVGMLIIGLISMSTGYWAKGIEVMSYFYVGFAPTFIGSIKGAIWGFFDGFIGGVIIAWLYNKLVSRK